MRSQGSGHSDEDAHQLMEGGNVNYNHLDHRNHNHEDTDDK